MMLEIQVLVWDSHKNMTGWYLFLLVLQVHYKVVKLYNSFYVSLFTLENSLTKMNSVSNILVGLEGIYKEWSANGYILEARYMKKKDF